MMKIEFRTSGAAFQDEYADEATNDMYTRDEILRILTEQSWMLMVTALASGRCENLY